MTPEKDTKHTEPRPHLRWKNFRSFKDSDWFELCPLTVILGSNNSGKTNLIRPLLLMKQTLDSGDSDLALKITGPLADVGTYKSIAHDWKPNRPVEFALRFEVAGKEQPPPLGDSPPSEVKLEFEMGNNPLKVNLGRFELMDRFGRSCLVRERMADGSYTLSTDIQMKPDLREAALATKPTHFLFEGLDVLGRVFQEQQKATKVGKRKRSQKIKFEIGGAFLSLLMFSEHRVTDLLSNLKYVGPLRDYPKRFYESTEEVPEEVGVRGELTPQILHLSKNPRLLERTNHWLASLGLASSVSTLEFHDELFTVNVTDIRNESTFDYSDSGFGLSQLLPLIVQGFHSQERETLFFEQPEIHLNPRLQTQLANLFKGIADNQKTVIVETHSEHLVLRIRTLIAEGELDSSRVAFYFVDKQGQSSTLRRIPVSPNGHIKSDEWPVGFFEESLGEALRLAQAPKTKGDKTLA